MREILFRAKRIDNGEWVYGGLSTYGEHAFIIKTELQLSESDNVYFSTTGIEVDPATMGQFTGLPDKNGKRIFEGDKIRIRETEADDWEAYSVKYYGKIDYPAFDTKPQIECDSNGLSYAMAACEVEVIGTIHDKEVNQ